MRLWQGLLVSALSLLMGAAIYLGFRPNSLVIFDWADYLGLGGLIEELRAHSLPYGTSLPEWLVFSVPNGLWVLSFSVVMVSIWGVDNLLIAAYWTASLWGAGIMSEFLQAARLIPGVFDVSDLVSYTVGGVAVFLFMVLKRGSGVR